MPSTISHYGSCVCVCVCVCVCMCVCVCEHQIVFNAYKFMNGICVTTCLAYTLPQHS